VKEELNPDWFEIYENTIDQLVFVNSFEKADLLIDSLEHISLRDRYKERLSELKEWRNFVYSKSNTN
jgi:hypothetical protein